MKIGSLCLLMLAMARKRCRCFDMKITATNKATGEVIELDANDLAEIVEAWRVVQEYEKAAGDLREQLKKLVPAYANNKGLTDEVDNHMFRVSHIQRMNYDKAIMRRVLDEDIFDVLLRPDKPAIDKYLKENLETLGGASTELRESMIPDGKAYQVIRLEKLSL